MVIVVMEIKHNLICHVTLKDHAIKESPDFIERSSSSYVIALPSLEAIHIASGDHVLKGLHNFVGGSFLY